MGEEKVVIRVEQEVEDCFECPYCVQPTDVMVINGYCSRGDFKIDNAFWGVSEKCPFRKENQK